jgi:hypothetical protein
MTEFFPVLALDICHISKRHFAAALPGLGRQAGSKAFLLRDGLQLD